MHGKCLPAVVVAIGVFVVTGAIVVPAVVAATAVVVEVLGIVVPADVVVGDGLPVLIVVVGVAVEVDIGVLPTDVKVEAAGVVVTVVSFTFKQACTFNLKINFSSSVGPTGTIFKADTSSGGSNLILSGEKGFVPIGVQESGVTPLLLGVFLYIITLSKLGLSSINFSTGVSSSGLATVKSSSTDGSSDRRAVNGSSPVGLNCSFFSRVLYLEGLTVTILSVMRDESPMSSGHFSSDDVEVSITVVVILLPTVLCAVGALVVAGSVLDKCVVVVDCAVVAPCVGLGLPVSTSWLVVVEPAGVVLPTVVVLVVTGADDVVVAILTVVVVVVASLVVDCVVVGSVLAAVVPEPTVDAVVGSISTVVVLTCRVMQAWRRTFNL